MADLASVASPPPAKIAKPTPPSEKGDSFALPMSTRDVDPRDTRRMMSSLLVNDTPNGGPGGAPGAPGGPPPQRPYPPTSSAPMPGQPRPPGAAGGGPGSAPPGSASRLPNDAPGSSHRPKGPDILSGPPGAGPSGNGAMVVKRDDNSMDEANKEDDWMVGYNPSVQTNLDIELAYNLDHDSVVCCVKFSHDGQYLATGSNKKTQIFDVATGEKALYVQLVVVVVAVVIVVTNEPRSFVLSCRVSSTFNYDAQDRDFLYIRSVCFHPSGKYLACGDEDKTIKLWDMDTKTVSHTFTGHDLDIYSLDFSSDGNIIVSGSGDKKVKIWDIEKRKCLETLGNDEVGPKDGVTSVAISPDGRLVAAVC